MIKLQTKIILWIFIILERFLCGAQIESINSNELLAFEEFLRAHDLKHALVVPSSHGQIRLAKWRLEWTRQMADYRELLANYRVQFFTSKMGFNFSELFYYEAPRTAIFVASLEDEAMQTSVYAVASQEGYFNHSQAWFLLGTSRADRTDKAIIEQHLSLYNITIDADITVAMRSAASSKSVGCHVACE